MSKRVAILKGSSILLLSLAYGCVNTVPGGPQSAVSGPQIAGSGLISNSAGGLISNNAGGLISNNAGGLISNNAGGLISNNAGGLISNNAGGLISNNAGGLSGSVKGPSAGLISNNAGGLISNNAGGLISNNAGGLISNNAGGLISNNAGGYRTLQLAADEFVLVPGAKVAVFNERNEMVSYGWSTVDKAGNYSFKRLKDSTHILFLKAVYQVGDKQVTLMAVCKAPREATTVTANMDPATTLVAKKVLEMLRLRVVSVSTVKAESFITMAEKLAPAMSDAAAVLAVLQTPEKAAQTFDQTIGAIGAVNPTLKAAIASTVASAPAVISETPKNVGVDSNNSPVNPTPTPVPTTAPTTPSATATPVNASIPAPTGAVSTIEGITITSATNMAAAPNGNTVVIANGNMITSLTAQTTTSVAVANVDNGAAVLAVAVSGGGNYYLTGQKIVKPGGFVNIPNVANPSDFVVNGGFAYVTSQLGHVIYKVDLNTGTSSVLAGTLNSTGKISGAGADTRFNGPRGIAFDASANALFVADSGNRTLRKVTLDGVSSPFSGSGNLNNNDGDALGAGYRNPVDVTADGAGNLYVVDAGSGSIRKVTAAGAVTTIAGNGSASSTDGTGAAASFQYPASIAVGSLNGFPILFVGEEQSKKIRVIQNW